MSNHNRHYCHNDFNAEQTADYTLLVQIGTTSFSYAVVDQYKLLALDENVSIGELTEPSEEHSILFANYKERVIGLPQNGFTFVPVSLFRPDRVTDFARFLDVKETETVLSQPLDAENQVIYKVDEQIAKTVIEKYGINNTVFGAKGWIKATAENNPLNHHIYLDVDNDRVEFLNFKDGKLRFYNSFEFKAADELVYFILFVAEELKLQPQNTALFLSGDISPNDENAERLAKFFGKVELNNQKSIDLPREITSHSVLTLTALSLCGSSEAL